MFIPRPTRFTKRSGNECTDSGNQFNIPPIKSRRAKGNAEAPAKVALEAGPEAGLKFQDKANSAKIIR